MGSAIDLGVLQNSDPVAFLKQYGVAGFLLSNVQGKNTDIFGKNHLGMSRKICLKQ